MNGPIDPNNDSEADLQIPVQAQELPDVYPEEAKKNGVKPRTKQRRRSLRACHHPPGSHFPSASWSTTSSAIGCAFDVAARLGFDIVHTSAIPEAWLNGPERQLYIDAARKSSVTIASMFVGFDGQSYADMASIRRTVGLVIPDPR